MSELKFKDKIDPDKIVNMDLTVHSVATLGKHLASYLEKITPQVKELMKAKEAGHDVGDLQKYNELVTDTANLIQIYHTCEEIAKKEFLKEE